MFTTTGVPDHEQWTGTGNKIGLIYVYFIVNSFTGILF